MALKIDANFKRKLTCAFKKEMRSLVDFHILENSDFILESKKAETNQNRNSKLSDRPDVFVNFILPLEINEWHN